MVKVHERKVLFQKKKENSIPLSEGKKRKRKRRSFYRRPVVKKTLSEPFLSLLRGGGGEKRGEGRLTVYW